MNKTCLIGRLTADIEVKQSKDTTYCNFTIAVNRQGKDAKADFIQCVAFNKTAEAMEKYCKKGDRVGIAGRIQVDPYTDKEGNKRSSFRIMVENVDFLQEKQKGTRNSDDNDIPDDVPFN